MPERRSLSAKAANTLRELILLEKRAPGTPDPERDLAEGLGISRTLLSDRHNTLVFASMNPAHPVPNR